MLRSPSRLRKGIRVKSSTNFGECAFRRRVAAACQQTSERKRANYRTTKPKIETIHRTAECQNVLTAEGTSQRPAAQIRSELVRVGGELDAFIRLLTHSEQSIRRIV